MFILNVIKIFFRNKYREIKSLSPDFTTLWECLILIGIVIVVALAVVGIGYGTGYLLIETFDIIHIDSNSDTPYIGVGLFFWIFVGIVGYLTYVFFKWIWTNIKIAIAEAKEMGDNTNNFK